MKPEYLDGSEAAGNEVLKTVLEILKAAKVKLEKERPVIFVLEGVMPNAIRALYKAGFHRTTSTTNSGRYLALRRLNILVDVQLPPVHFGADVLVKRLKKSQKLILHPMYLSKEEVVARTREDSHIDISYESVLAIYKENEELNAWRNHMQFVPPENEEVRAIITLLDRCIGLHETGSAVDYDKFDVRWMGGVGKKNRLIYIPSSGHYDIEVNIDAFSWNCSGSDFSYSETAEDLWYNVKHHLETTGDTLPNKQQLKDFQKGMAAHLRNMESQHYNLLKHLV
jgi:hypothetical protein